MNVERRGQELGRLMGVVQDARQLSATRWRQNLAKLTDAPLALRLAIHHGVVREELRHAFPGLDMIQDPHLAAILLVGVVDTGEDLAAVEAAAGMKLS